jgi:hypothetical protein
MDAGVRPCQGAPSPGSEPVAPSVSVVTGANSALARPLGIRSRDEAELGRSLLKLLVRGVVLKANVHVQGSVERNDSVLRLS